jgi:hypothetical protein
MAEHWPDTTGDYAAFMNNIPMVVFSKTLPAADWAGSRLARGDITDEIAASRANPAATSSWPTAASRSSVGAVSPRSTAC